MTTSSKNHSMDFCKQVNIMTLTCLIIKIPIKFWKLIIVTGKLSKYHQNQNSDTGDRPSLCEFCHAKMRLSNLTSKLEISFALQQNYDCWQILDPRASLSPRIQNSYPGNGPKRFEFSRDKMRLSNPASEAEIASVDMSSSEKMVVASNKNSSLISFHSDAPIRSRKFVK